MYVTKLKLYDLISNKVTGCQKIIKKPFINIDLLIFQKPHMGVSNRISQKKDTVQTDEGGEFFSNFHWLQMLTDLGNLIKLT